MTRILCLLILLSSSVLAVWSMSPPDVVPKGVNPQGFSAERGYEHLKVIAQKPHPVGTPEHAKVQKYIVDQLKKWGFKPQVQETSEINSFMGKTVGARVQNIVCRIPGQQSSKAILLAVHYDSVPHSYGASDDGSGVVSLLEVARILSEGEALKNDIILLFTDAEELGLIGATAFMREHPWVAEVGLVFNFEARGNTGPVAMFETSARNGVLIQDFAQAIDHPMSNSFVTGLAKLIPNDTDMTIFKKFGLVGLNFAYANGLQHYHTSRDDLKSIDLRSVQHHGDSALALVRYYGNRDLSIDFQSQESYVYFDLFNRWLVHYPKMWGPILTGLVVFLFLFLCGFMKAKGILRWKKVFGSFLLYIGEVVLILGAFIGISLIQNKYISTYLKIVSSEVFALGFLSLFLALWFLFDRNKRIKFGRDEEVFLGRSLLLVFLLLGLSWAYSRGSYILHWPLLFSFMGAIAILWRDKKDAFSLWLRTLGVLPGVVILSSTAYLLFSLDGGKNPWAFVLPLLLLMPLLLWSLAPFSFWRHKMFSFILVDVGLALLVFGTYFAEYSEKYPKPQHLVYAVHLPAKQAYWISEDVSKDPWLQRWIPEGQKDVFDSFFAKTWEYDTASAPFEKKPELKVKTEREVVGGVQKIDFAISPNSETRCIFLWEGTGIQVQNVRVNGKTPFYYYRFGEELDAKVASVTRGSYSHHWKLRFCGFTGEPLRVYLEVPSERKLFFHLIEEIPSLPKRVKMIPRTPEMMPVRHGDTTLVYQSLEF